MLGRGDGKGARGQVQMANAVNQREAEVFPAILPACGGPDVGQSLSRVAAGVDAAITGKRGEESRGEEAARIRPTARRHLKALAVFPKILPGGGISCQSVS